MSMQELMSIHPLLADRVRLSIMAALAGSTEPIEFTRLLELLELTRGNLSTHMRKLEEAEFVRVLKEFANRKPRTTYELTKEGRKELEHYLKTVELALKAVKRSKGK